MAATSTKRWRSWLDSRPTEEGETSRTLTRLPFGTQHERGRDFISDVIVTSESGKGPAFTVRLPEARP
jgi:hypothetical protein